MGCWGITGDKAIFFDYRQWRKPLHDFPVPNNNNNNNNNNGLLTVYPPRGSSPVKNYNKKSTIYIKKKQ